MVYQNVLYLKTALQPNRPYNTMVTKRTYILFDMIQGDRECLILPVRDRVAGNSHSQNSSSLFNPCASVTSL